MPNVFKRYGVQLDKCGVLLTATDFVSLNAANLEYRALSSHADYSGDSDYEVTLYECGEEGEEARVIRRHRGGDV